MRKLLNVTIQINLHTVTGTENCSERIMVHQQTSSNVSNLIQIVEHQGHLEPSTVPPQLLSFAHTATAPFEGTVDIETPLSKHVYPGLGS